MQDSQAGGSGHGLARWRRAVHVDGIARYQLYAEPAAACQLAALPGSDSRGRNKILRHVRVAEHRHRTRAAHSDAPGWRPPELADRQHVADHCRCGAGPHSHRSVGFHLRDLPAHWPEPESVSRGLLRPDRPQDPQLHRHQVHHVGYHGLVDLDHSLAVRAGSCPRVWRDGFLAQLHPLHWLDNRDTAAAPHRPDPVRERRGHNIRHLIARGRSIHDWNHRGAIGHG